MTVIETKVIALVCIRSTTVGTTFHKCGIVASVEVKLGECDNTNIAALKRLELGGFACNQLRRRYNARAWIVHRCRIPPLSIFRWFGSNSSTLAIES